MPSSSTTSRKRNSRSSRTSKEGATSNHGQTMLAPRAQRETLASKTKKRMPEEEIHDGTKGKRVRPEGEKESERDDSSIAEWCNAPTAEGSVSCVVPTSRLCERLMRSGCLPHYLYAARLGMASPVNRKSVLSPVVRELSDLRLFRTASPFDRRVTALDWHPTMPGMVVAGSKGGDLILWNSLRQNLNDHFIQGVGAGGSVQAVKVWPWNSDHVLTTSIDGRVMVRDWTQRYCQILTDTGNCVDYWYCSVDVSAPRKAVLTGDNMGNTLLLSLEGKKLWSHRLHKQKVTHVEFSPREDWLFVTASIDGTVKVWDLRNLYGRHSALSVLKHKKPVNSAYFSRTDGCRLLTTDQHSEVRVYRSPGWHLETTVHHPHRFFQHLTPIKATWHPLHDLAVIGRYPSKDFPGYTENERRTIDIIDVDTGDTVHQLHDPSAPGIVSSNKFNDRGDYLVSGMGVNMLLWGCSRDVEDRQRSMLENYQHGDLDLLRSNRHRAGGHSARQRSSSSSRKSKAKETDIKVKVSTKTKAKTQKR